MQPTLRACPSDYFLSTSKFCQLHALFGNRGQAHKLFNCQNILFTNIEA